MLLLWGFMAVVSHYVLGNILGLQQLDAAVTIQHNSCAKSAKLSIKNSRETKTQKMMNNSVKQMIQMQSKSIKSAILLHPAVCDLRCMRNKSTVVVVLVQKQENHDITFKQQMRDYITTYRQLDTKALYRLDISS